MPRCIYLCLILRKKMKASNHLYILSKGRLGAVNKKDGSLVWEVKLKTYLSNGLSLSIGQLTVEGNRIYVASTGVLLCLATKDGSLVWKNELKGWGYQYVSMAGDQGSAVAQASQDAGAMAAIVAATA
jgi:outer membrane protein assembly factor BamB